MDVNVTNPNLSRQTAGKRSPFVWIKDAWHLTKPYWKSQNKYQSAGFIGLIIVFNLLVVYMTVLFNKWYNVFYDAIQHLDKVAFTHAIYKFSIMAFFYILFQIGAFYFRKILEIRWRRWLTKYYLDNWFSKQAYYRTRFVNQISDNPDQRISEDINSFIVLLLDITLGFMNSVVTLISFSVILWNISGSLKFTLMGHHVVIPGYMLFAAIIYAIVGTIITFKIGRPLIGLNYQQQAYEADFRFGLMRVREHAENIAFYHGETLEKGGLVKRFNNVVDNFVRIIYRQIKIDIFSVGYGQIALIFPLVVAAPRYFAKIIQLGDLMQIAQAFNKVQDALSYFINAYTSLAGIRATMDRLYGFQEMVENADKLDGLSVESGKTALTLKDVTVDLPNGNPLLNNISVSLNQGDRLLIKGASGSGKTTLLRAVAGLWHFSSGHILQVPKLQSLFIAQKPYLPIGSLKYAICYPMSTGDVKDEVVLQLLDNCNLKHLKDDLHTEAVWDNKLSLGEQQRIAFCRVLVNRPDIVYLDEATSALDEDTEEQMYQMLDDELKNSVIVSVGHRSTIKKWHNYELDVSAA